MNPLQGFRGLSFHLEPYLHDSLELYHFTVLDAAPKRGRLEPLHLLYGFSGFLYRVLHSFSEALV